MMSIRRRGKLLREIGHRFIGPPNNAGNATANEATVPAPPAKKAAEIVVARSLRGAFDVESRQTQYDAQRKHHSDAPQKAKWNTSDKFNIKNTGRHTERDHVAQLSS